ncbi:hypothetical protein [Streptomyces sp. NPDC055287]
MVAGLVAAAVGAVAFLAYQASASAPSPARLAESGAGKVPAAHASQPAKAPAKVKNPLAVPAQSGTGTRVVYALAERRVWLVNGAGTATRIFQVAPSTVSPPPGTYAVSSRSGTITGSDGVRIEHVVRFTTVDDVPIGFSAAVDGSMPSPDPKSRTGGVRMPRADGDALWSFATVGVKVVVVP